MMVQPRTLFIGIFTLAAVLIAGVVYFIVRASSGNESESENSAAVIPEVVSEAQITKTPLFEYAQIANLVRAAYDQKIAAGEDENAKIICGDMFEEVDLALVAQTLSLDIDEKIDEIVSQKQISENEWSDCASNCTCTTLVNLYEKATNAGIVIPENALEMAQESAEGLTTGQALKCAEANINICQSPLLRKYAEQAATIE